jgi:hypothetical protein
VKTILEDKTYLLEKTEEFSRSMKRIEQKINERVLNMSLEDFIKKYNKGEIKLND